MIFMGRCQLLWRKMFLSAEIQMHVNSSTSYYLLRLRGKEAQDLSVCLEQAALGKLLLSKAYGRVKSSMARLRGLLWVAMRENFSYHEFINTLKQQLDSKRKKTDTFRLPNRTNNRTSAKGILLVLDAVPSKKDWDVIKSALPVLQDKVSQVIITTRDPSIAKLCEKSYNLPPLQDGYLLELFKKKVSSTCTLPQNYYHCTSSILNSIPSR